MKRLLRQCIHKVKPYTPGKPIEEVQRQLNLKEVIKLASNENPLGPSPKALRAIRANLKNINRYPDASCFYLKEELARYLGVGKDSLVIGNGSDEIISLAIKAFVEKGDEVVIANPTFLIYEIASQAADANIVLVPLERFKYDLEAMARAITPKTKMVFIANPDNPTGTYVTKIELEKFLDSVPSSTIVFLDEAYYEFAKEMPGYPDGMRYLKRPNIIVARTFSKAYGLSGLRVGYGISNPEVAGYLERVREPFNVNILAQYAACAALDDRQFLRKTLKHVSRQKEMLYGRLKEMGISYVESATNFILVHVRRDCKELFTALLKKGVIVRDMKAWGLNDYIRVTIGTRGENLKFLKALKEVMR